MGDLPALAVKPTTRAPSFFFSYNSLDYEWVQSAQAALLAKGVGIFVDRDNLSKGLPWQSALEEALSTVSAVAVFVGPNGLGRWQMREIWLALDIQSRKTGTPFPVVPVLLPGSDRAPMFLTLNTWVEVKSKATATASWDALASVFTEGSNPPDNEVIDEICPYRGLSAFREIDAPFFFGRNELARRIANKFHTSSFVAVVGASGSGKSSLVAAGVVPILRRQTPPDSSWEFISFTPGDRPFHRLATALVASTEMHTSNTDSMVEAKKLGDALSKGEIVLGDYIESFLFKALVADKILVIADQFEELFTMGRDGVPAAYRDTSGPSDKPRAAFVNSLLGACRSGRISLLVTLRSDYYGHAITLTRDFSDSLELGVINVGQMTTIELTSLIEEPARIAGLTFEDDLPRELLDDVISEPGNLPLLEFALTELWKLRIGRQLTRNAYKTIGKVEGALANRATTVYEALSDSEKRLTRDIFSRLVRLGSPDDGTEDSRQRARVSDFIQQAQSVIKKLADARLIVTSRDATSGDEIVEVVHEALVRRWDQVKSWLNEDREFLLWRQRLHSDVIQYEFAHEDRSALLRGSVLTEAASWQARYKVRLNETENKLIVESLKRSHLNKWLVRFAVAFLVVAAWLSVWWLNQQLQQETRLSDLQRLHLLESGADKLWPADSSHVPDLEVWLQSAEELAPRLSQYTNELARAQATEAPALNALRKQQDEMKAALSSTAGSIPSQSLIGGRDRLRHVTESILPYERRLEVLSDLVTGLNHLVDPNSKIGLIASMQARLNFARGIHKVSIDDERSSWDATIASIADQSICPKYRGLVIRPQEGLVPLQRNRDSGLWEFWQVQTGTRPPIDSAGEVRPTADSGLTLVLIPSGAFMMGSHPVQKGVLGPNDDPWADTDESDERGDAFLVTIRQPFFISKFEMTQGQFVRTALNNPSYYQPLHDGGDVTFLNPVEQVTWSEASELMVRLGLDLPTEEQWEYAARGGTSTVWWSGNTIASLAGNANIADTRYHSAGQPGTSEALLNDGHIIHAKVGSFRPNPFGLYDTIGNVWEWCKDLYRPYRAANLTKRIDPSEHVMRGGGWGSSAAFSRSATRDHFKPEFRYYALGFRPAKQLND